MSGKGCENNQKYGFIVKGFETISINKNLISGLFGDFKKRESISCHFRTISKNRELILRYFETISKINCLISGCFPVISFWVALISYYQFVISKEPEMISVCTIWHI